MDNLVSAITVVGEFHSTLHASNLHKYITRGMQGHELFALNLAVYFSVKVHFELIMNYTN